MSLRLPVRTLNARQFSRLGRRSFAALWRPAVFVCPIRPIRCGFASEADDVLADALDRLFAASLDGTRSTLTRSNESLGELVDRRPSGADLASPTIRDVPSWAVATEEASAALRSGDSFAGVIGVCSCGIEGCGIRLGVIRGGLLRCALTFEACRLRHVEMGARRTQIRVA